MPVINSPYKSNRGLSIRKTLFLLLPFFFCAGLQAATITFTVDTSAPVSVIPPYCYGSNNIITNNPTTQTTPTITLVNNIPLYRQGGNRLTAYNWENNASNAGMDWGPNHEDWYMVPNNVLPPGMPATTLTSFILSNNAVLAASLVTLQMAGYVSADGNCNCDVTVTGAADTSGTYWKTVSFTGGPSSGTPVTTDNVVYMDEAMHYLVNSVGSAGRGGALFYDLDNEPGIWNGTHPLVHPAQAACSEVAGKGVSLATVITSIDPGAQVLGPVAYGWGEYTNNQGAPDAVNLSSYDNGNYIPYLNYYLATMNTASSSASRRLLHYLDLHWYPEATGNGVRITNDDTSQLVAIARMQAPRSLWDPTYTETSWIAQNSLPNSPITLIPRLQAAVSQYYHGTKLFFSEYQYGSGEDISGGVAQADALGIFGKYGVGACRWDDGTNNAYVGAAFNLYLNYNGAGAGFGDLSMPLSVPSASIALASGYASRSNSQPNKIWIVAISRNYSSASVTDTGSFTLNNLSGGQGISSIKSYRFDSTHSTLYSPVAPVTTSATSFTDNLPGRSGTLYEITLNQTFITFTPSPTATSMATPTKTPTPTNSPTLTRTHTFTATLTPSQTKTSTITPTLTITAVMLTPAITLTPTDTISPTPWPTGVPTYTYTDTPTATDTLTITSTPTSTPPPTITWTQTDTPTFTDTLTATNSPTNTPSPTFTWTQTETYSPTATSSPTLSMTPTPSCFYVGMNVFQPSQAPVTISFCHSNSGHYSLKIYNSAGEHIKTFLDGHIGVSPASQTYLWDGTNKDNDECASGVYLLKLSKPNGTQWKRIILIK